MKNLKTIISAFILLSIIISTSSCKTDKTDDGSTTGTKQYVPSQIIINTTGNPTPVFTINYTYNDDRQITRMVQDESGDVTTWDFNYLSNGNLNRLDYAGGGDNGVVNCTYDSNNRLNLIQEVAGGSTTDLTVTHMSSSNTYTVLGGGSTTGLEVDLDANDDIEELRNSLAGDISLTYLTDQNGVFANVALNPSVIMPFHLVASYIYYYMQPNQITQMSTSGVGTIMYSDQVRDEQGNLTSFRVNGSAIDETFTVTYELK